MEYILKKLRKDDPCWCNSGKAYGECHAAFDKKIEVFKKKFHKVPPRSIIKNEQQLQGISIRRLRGTLRMPAFGFVTLP